LFAANIDFNARFSFLGLRIFDIAQPKYKGNTYVQGSHSSILLTQGSIRSIAADGSSLTSDGGQSFLNANSFYFYRRPFCGKSCKVSSVASGL
jgi:hypothetical protein